MREGEGGGAQVVAYLRARASTGLMADEDAGAATDLRASSARTRELREALALTQEALGTLRARARQLRGRA